MAPKKRSRAATRCKPVLTNITNKLTVDDEKERLRRALIIDDFKRNVMLRVETLKEEQTQLEVSLMKSYEIFRQRLLPWQNVTVKQLLESEKSDTVDGRPAPTPQASKRGAVMQPQQEGLTSTAGLRGDGVGTSAADSNPQNIDLSKNSNISESQQHEMATFAIPEAVLPKAARMSDISALIAETGTKFATAKSRKKKANPPIAAAAAATPLPASATRSSSRLRRGPTDGPGASLGPPSMTRALRAKKACDTAMFVTPAGQRVCANKLGAQLLVTPKFDPRFPLPPNTTLRRPLPQEVPMSVTGSPLSLSPSKPKLKEITAEFLSMLEREVPNIDRTEMKNFKSVLQRHIESKP
ncbi:uncharacterized protein LOC108674408 [Hyalella azteca]|uniref:Uncharacterized protein LOC108674408 n=1 Tax=Hyalella azteca TaxID=294128 RepID=A0A8B7NVN8_HYAAZ|nr:uncharacterized protein LOC108674408 [Hyalella azteca]